jgi:predicted transcriptional regulator
LKVSPKALIIANTGSYERPVFIVLYNGTDPYADEAVLKLSDAFADAASLGLPKSTPPDLELSVKVYNINHGHNEAIIRRCEKLEGYSVFIAKVREFSEELSGGRKPAKLTGDELARAIKQAVKWCIANNKLKQFLESHSVEVSSMLMTEWNWDDAMEVLREETWEEAREETWTERGEEIARNALAKGLSMEVISEITGLSTEDVERIAGE